MSQPGAALVDATQQVQPLTKNQRKRRRKLLGKLFGKDKREQGGGSGACMCSLAEEDCSEASLSVASHVSAAVVSCAGPSSKTATAAPSPAGAASRKRGRGSKLTSHASSAGIPESHASSATHLHSARQPACPPTSTASAPLLSSSTAAAEVASAPAAGSGAEAFVAPGAHDGPQLQRRHRHAPQAPQAAARLRAHPHASSPQPGARPSPKALPQDPGPAAPPAPTAVAEATAPAASAVSAPQPPQAVAHEPAGAAPARQAQEEQEAPEEEAVRKKPRRSFVHGNYHGYYGYRLGGEQQEDPRLEVFEAEWFQGRRVLDVGCNVGVVTLAVAVNFHPRSTVGLDIDGKLVGRACRALAEMRSELTQQLGPQEGYIPKPLAASPSQPPTLMPTSTSTVDTTPTPSDPSPIPCSRSFKPLSGPPQTPAAPSCIIPDPGPQSTTPSSPSTLESPSTDPSTTATANTIQPDGLALLLPPAAGPADSQLPAHPLHTRRHLHHHCHTPSDAPSTTTTTTTGHNRPCSDAPSTTTTTATTTTTSGHKRPRSDAAKAAAAAQLPAVRRPQPGEWKRLRGAIKALSRTTFRQEDWGSTPARPGTADTILCLSVTKWIHLHSGDDGLKRVFRKFHRTLAPGGLLVLEPQPWKSYRSAMRKQRQALAGAPALAISTLDQLQLRPHQFLEFLTREVGFELLKEAHVDQSAQGFDRPIYVLRRPARAAAAEQAQAASGVVAGGMVHGAADGAAEAGGAVGRTPLTVA